LEIKPRLMLFVVFISKLLSQYETITATFKKKVWIKTSGVCDFICCQGVRTSIYFFFFFFVTEKALTNKMVYSRNLDCKQWNILLLFPPYTHVHRFGTLRAAQLFKKVSLPFTHILVLPLCPRTLAQSHCILPTTLNYFYLTFSLQASFFLVCHSRPIYYPDDTYQPQYTASYIKRQISSCTRAQDWR
jgi:hypothetical protein